MKKVEWRASCHVQNVMPVWVISTGRASNATVGPGSPQPFSSIKVKSILALFKMWPCTRGVQIRNWSLTWRHVHIQSLWYRGTNSRVWYHRNTLYNFDMQLQKKWTFMCSFCCLFSFANTFKYYKLWTRMLCAHISAIQAHKSSVCVFI